MKSEVRITGNRLQISRWYAAPRRMVFAYWTQLEKMQQWTGCKDATKVEIQAEARPGGTFTQKMQIAGAGEYTLTGTYQDIIEPERIVYTANMGPALIRVTIGFSEEGEGTKVVVTQEGFPDATDKLCPRALANPLRSGTNCWPCALNSEFRRMGTQALCKNLRDKERP